jgi:cellulose synthase/poly-beta-1,6-N-acetylglucosamine synthase-like glycosyltransferase
MTLLELDLSALFLLAVILIWFMIGYQFVLTVFGYINFLRSAREKKEIDAMDLDLPPCTILIPAHNEEKVIRRTVEAMTRLEYPHDRLRIVVINDGSSDRTREIIQDLAAHDQRVVLLDVPEGQGGKGKSRALNLGIRQVESEVVAIYDADNTPEPEALRYLVAQLVLHPELGAVLGKFRTVNKDATLLTRFINIETLGFQSMLQAGRSQFHHIATLPGTNYVMRTALIQRLHGWDEDALTEDSELSIRIYEEGYVIGYIPYAITWEQEPQEWGVWIRQRMRWVRGNNYVIGKFFRRIPHFKNRRLGYDLLYTLALYYVFFAAIVISDLLFIVSLLALVSIALPGPYTAVWVLAFVLFLAEILVTLSYDREDSLRNLGLAVLMYFTYCQLWMYVVVRAWWSDYVRKDKRVWAKTERFDVAQSTETSHDQ